MFTRITGAAFVSLMLMGAAFADNFAFAVPGEPGLELTISGYDRNNSRVFVSRVDSVENYMGAPHYIVRVDETVLILKPLAKWCVEGLSDADVELCDANPRETRGTYLFAAPPPKPEQPSEPNTVDSAELACAADALKASGYFSTGSGIDHRESVRRAAVRFAALQKEDPKLPKLDDQSLEQWCKRFAAVKAAGIAPLPPLLDNLNFGPDVELSLARDTAKALLQANSFLEAVVGYRFKEAPAIYISADPAWLTEGYSERTSLSPAERKQREEQFAACNGGEANYRVLFVCTKSKVFSEDWFSVGRQTQHAYALVHELFHVVQNELIGPAGNGCCDEVQSLGRIGPTWLVEGSAEYVAFQLLASAGWKDFRKEMQHQAEGAKRSGLTAEDVELRGAYYSRGDAPFVGLAATHELVGSTGPQALPRFWAALGEGKDWKAAFNAAFGLTPASFYETGDKRVAQEVTTSEMVQCVQSTLNQLGFDAGPVDGELGRATRVAFEAYAAKQAPVFTRYQFDKAEMAGTVCLYMARHHELDAMVEDIANRLTLQSTFAIAFGADPESVKSIAVRDGEGSIVAETEVLATVKRSSDGMVIKSLRMPYVLAKEGSQVCMRTSEGWVIKGNDGKAYQVSCDRIDPALATRGLGINYRVERGEPG